MERLRLHPNLRHTSATKAVVIVVGTALALAVLAAAAMAATKRAARRRCARPQRLSDEQEPEHGANC